MGEPVLSHPGVERPIRGRTRRDPKPHFKSDTTAQLGGIRGYPAWQVPAGHLAPAVQRSVGRLDLSSVEAQYSSLGGRGSGRRKLSAVRVDANLIWIHYGAKLAGALQTDAALRLLSCGHAISRSKRNEFRQQHGALLSDCGAQTVATVQGDGLLVLDDVAADRMRLRAQASTKTVRTFSRSQKRLAELAAVDGSALSTADPETHRASVEKPACAASECETGARTSIVTTNLSAALLKVPDGSGLPGHRISTMVAGAQARFLIEILFSADTNDDGLLEPIVEKTEKRLGRSAVCPATQSSRSPPTRVTLPRPTSPPTRAGAIASPS